MIEISAWDPALLLVDALRKLGPDARRPSCATISSACTGWTGANGPYDFRPTRSAGSVRATS